MCRPRRRSSARVRPQRRRQPIAGTACGTRSPSRERYRSRSNHLCLRESAVASDGGGERRGRRWKRPFVWRADFSFWSTRRFPTRRRAIPGEISLRNVKGPESGARSELVMGNGRRFEARKQRLFPRPLPIIGVRRAIVQCRAHDDDRAPPAVALGPEIPMASAFQLPTPEQGVFLGGGESADSWTPGPKPLCHRHPTGPHPNGLLWTPAKGRFDENQLRARRL